jgi:hypothetical protein
MEIKDGLLKRLCGNKLINIYRRKNGKKGIS